MWKIRITLPSLALLIGLSMSCVSAWGQSAESDPSGRLGRPFEGAAVGEVVNQIHRNGLVILSTGRATQLGTFRQRELLFLSPDGTLVGQLVFLTDSGDQLYANVRGQFISRSMAVGRYQLTGGTGRFRGVSGEASFEMFSPDGIEVDVAFDGMIRY